MKTTLSKNEFQEWKKDNESTLRSMLVVAFMLVTTWAVSALAVYGAWKLWQLHLSGIF